MLRNRADFYTFYRVSDILFIGKKLDLKGSNPMKKSLIFVIVLFFVFLLSSCAQTEKSSNDNLKMLDVELSVAPEKVSLNEPITFQAKVRYGEELVTDANKVSFEIWRLNDKHDRIEVKHDKGGVYQLQKSFTIEGTYFVYAHVTAKGMHAMPKKQFIVGKPSETEDVNGDASKHMEQSEHEDAHNNQ
jgi:hypothetical protein